MSPQTIWPYICIALFIALPGVAHSSAASRGEHTQPANDHAILRCPVLQEVIREDGAFDIVSWHICKSKRCDQQNVSWLWLAGMNRTGSTQGSTERITITKEGGLQIKNGSLSDAGEYMCTVKRINHASPRRNLAFFAVKVIGIIEKGEEPTRKPSPPHDRHEGITEQGGGTTSKPSPHDCNGECPKNSGCLPYIVTMLLLVVLLVLAIVYILYLKETCRRGNQENSSGLRTHFCC